MLSTGNRVAIVTGASRGIGAATARLLATQGYAVCVNYRTGRDRAAAIVSQIEAIGGRALAAQADVSDEHDVVSLFKNVDSALGIVTALVNNAAILDKQSRVDEMPADRITRMFATNVTGPFLCAREAVRRMSRAHNGPGGIIVNVSSRAAKLGAPGEYVDYASSKAALEAFTVGLAAEVANEGIRVNGVRPGIIDTEIHAMGGEPARAHRLAASIPMQRAGTADEVARAITWLLSDNASASTGTFIDVAGGW